MKNAVYTGPNERLAGETAIVRDDPSDPNLVLAQFDRNPFYVGRQNLASGWHQFYRSHFCVEEPSKNRAVLLYAAETSYDIGHSADAMRYLVTGIKPELKRQWFEGDWTPFDVSEGLELRPDGKYYARCRSCGYHYHWDPEPHEFSEESNYCGGSPMCLP